MTVRKRLDKVSVADTKTLIRRVNNAHLNGGEEMAAKIWELTDKTLGEGCFSVFMVWYVPGRIGVLNFKEERSDGSSEWAFQRFTFMSNKLSLQGRWQPGKFRIVIDDEIEKPKAAEKPNKEEQLELPFAAT